MTTEPEKHSDSEEICFMCGRPKNKHSKDEMDACNRKMTEFKKQKDGGAGIQ